MKKFRSIAYYHTPPSAYRHMFHSVLRAGHHQIAPDFPVGNWQYPGHDLVLCLEGSGSVHIGGKAFTLQPGELIWFDCHHLDTHWPPRKKPWEILWMHIDSDQADAVAKALDVVGNPVFVLRKPAEAVTLFKTILRLLHTRPVAMDAGLHAAVTSLLTVLFEIRQTEVSTHLTESSDETSGHALAKVLHTMRAKSQQRWRVKDLAEMMCLSVQQFHRRFNSATGSSPAEWLRRERINHAKRRLAETYDRIDSIARSVGYADPQYFSRDFKKHVGVSPRQYRQQEQTLNRGGDLTDQ